MSGMRATQEKEIVIRLLQKWGDSLSRSIVSRYGLLSIGSVVNLKKFHLGNVVLVLLQYNTQCIEIIQKWTMNNWRPYTLQKSLQRNNFISHQQLNFCINTFLRMLYTSDLDCEISSIANIRDELGQSIFFPCPFKRKKLSWKTALLRIFVG